MTRKDVLVQLGRLTVDQQLRWMFDLGYSLTVSARGAYIPQKVDGNAAQLMGFNELQHQVYGRSMSLQRGDEWTLESFLDVLIGKAKLYGIEGDVMGAIRASLKFLPD